MTTINIAQAYQHLAHTRRDQLPQGSSLFGCHYNTRIMEDPTPNTKAPPPRNRPLPPYFRRATFLYATNHVAVGGYLKIGYSLNAMGCEGRSG